MSPDEFLEKVRELDPDARYESLDNGHTLVLRSKIAPKNVAYMIDVHNLEFFDVNVPEE